jgi:large subunit ribosomal protein L4
MKTDIYNHTGKVAGSIELPESIFGLEWNGDLVHQVVIAMQANARANTAHTKDRSEVSGGGKKPWRQKGTGQARHGSRRSPIWRGGGITFGPRSERNYSQKINKKMRSKALFVALSQKLRDGKIIFAEAIAPAEGKTSEMKKALEAFAGIEGFTTLNTKKHNNVFMTAVAPATEIKRATKNIHHVTLVDLINMNVVDVLNYRYLIITDPTKSVEVLTAKQSTK